MRNDQIFVLLLVVLLPMSGCFGGGTAGVGEAEGAQDTGGEDTSINRALLPLRPHQIYLQ